MIIIKQNSTLTPENIEDIKFIFFVVFINLSIVFFIVIYECIQSKLVKYNRHHYDKKNQNEREPLCKNKK